MINLFDKPSENLNDLREKYSENNKEESQKTKEKKEAIAKELAKNEIEWWKAHHRGEKEKIIKAMAEGFSLQSKINHEIDYEKAIKAAELKCEATQYHNEAERLEDETENVNNAEEKKEKLKQSDVFWDKAEECLYRHFLILQGVE